jgi:N-acetylmuramoyl-L-alanine amidase
MIIHLVITITILLSTSRPACAVNEEYCLENFVAAVDIGHHSLAPGTRDVFGRAELLYNAELATQLAQSLSELGFRRIVIINRNMNLPDLRSRPHEALCKGADVFISLHHDNVDASKKTHLTVEGKEIWFNDDIGGYTIYFSTKNREYGVSLELARSISRKLMTLSIPSAAEHREYIADLQRHLVDRDLNVWDFEELAVCKYSSIPAILIEAGFLSNRQDIARLQDASFRKKFADGVARGILAACTSYTNIGGLKAQIEHERARQCRFFRGLHPVIPFEH